MKFGVMPQRTSFLAGEREANEGQASGPANASNWRPCSPAVETTGKRNREGSGSKLEKSHRLSNAFHFCGRRPGLLPRCLCCLCKPGPLRTPRPCSIVVDASERKHRGALQQIQKPTSSLCCPQTREWQGGRAACHV